MSATSTISESHAIIDRVIGELREGGGDAAAFAADRDYREQILGTLLRGMRLLARKGRQD